MLTCYTSAHVHSMEVATAFSKGGPFKLRQVPCDIDPGDVFTYGNLRGLDRPIEIAKARGDRWFYGDRGYFAATRGVDYSGYFRVTDSDFMADGCSGPNGEQARPDRFERLAPLGVRIRPWRPPGSTIVVCPPGQVLGQLRGFDASDWLADTLAQLKAATDRPVKVRAKPVGDPGAVPLEADLDDAFAVVVYNSNSAVDALLYGVPIFATHKCAASIMGRSNLADIESPNYPDRFDWACNLAASQWTLQEMRNGTARAELGIN